MEIEQKTWGYTDKGDVIVLYTMTSNSGAYIQVSNVGAAICSIVVPDRDGNMSDVALGYLKAESYIFDAPAMGKSVGRFANRIANGIFSLDGVEYRLAQNNGVNHLHGGIEGFGNRVWESRVEVNRIVMTLDSPDGDQGYPGAVSNEVVFDWSDDHILEITYRAKSFAPTVINMTNHAYFNLAGHNSGSVLDHELQLNCNKWLVTDNTQIPTGEIADVANTPMDFTKSKKIGADIDAEFDALKIGYGYDHCWAVDGWKKESLSHVGTLYEPKCGRVMDIISTQPGVQIYTGNFLQCAPIGKDGYVYANRDGVAIECQAFPDAPNKPEFPSCRLDVEGIYEQSIIYSFSTDKN